MSRVFANGLGDRGSVPGRFILKTFKMVLDADLLSNPQCKVRIKGNVEQSMEKGCALPNTSVLWLLKRGSSGSPSTKVANFILLLIASWSCF